MAEILLSLTIIGIVAVLTLPALTGNINERVWNTQHKALYARMSQAIPLIPALNGYGNLEILNNGHKIIDTRAETFITSALSKVIKINNICDYQHFQDCGLPEKFTNMTGSKKDWPLSWDTIESSSMPDFQPYAAAFETQNGESIAVYYNKTCTSERVMAWHNSGYDSFKNICAVFMYDLNGKKGPNTMWKDIGVITVFYPTDSIVVAPRPYVPATNNKRLFKEAAAFCRQEYEQSRMSNLEETIAVGYYQTGLLGFPNYQYWANGQDKSKNPNGPFENFLESSTGYWTVSGDYFSLESTVYKDRRRNFVLCVRR